MKRKLNEEVTIRSDLVVGNIYGNDSFTHSMKKYLGKKAKITEVCNNFYRLDIDGGYWGWNDKMLEDAPKQSKHSKHNIIAVLRYLCKCPKGFDKETYDKLWNMLEEE